MENRAGHSMTILRITLSILIAAHGWARFLSDAVAPFGAWLDGLGFPFGMAIAVSITAIEILGTPLLAWGRFVLPLCVVYSLIYLGGIFLVHAPEGWFVVGLGRNGMEYGVLLIVCLLCVAWQHFPNRPASEARDP
jgi:putative oxidoreductase